MPIKDNQYTKIMRAEKTTPNVDDSKTLVVGFILFCVLLFVQNWIAPDFIDLNDLTNEVATQKED